MCYFMHARKRGIYTCVYYRPLNVLQTTRGGIGGDDDDDVDGTSETYIDIL